MQLIGRDAALVELADRLGQHRLVTVTGPGGIGKTACARSVTDLVRNRFPLGVHHVDLTRLDTGAGPGAVGAAIAGQLGFPSFETLLNSPSEQPALVVVDNCEHVLDDAADAVAELLDACESPVVLATSRSPLDLPGESVLVIGPLALPPIGLVDPDASAVRLFLERARDAGAAVEPTDVEMVTSLCRTLDGMPLAIELAAARARVLSPAELTAHLQDRYLDTLTRTRFRGPGRHRSLRDTIEWSYQFLDADDQGFFDRLAVLAGQFTVDDARPVAAGPADTTAVVLDRLDRLVAASLLVAERVAGVTRYRQLELLRAFAREQLSTRDEWDATWSRFIEHIVDWSVRLAIESVDRWDTTVLADLLTRVDSQLAALRWCVEHDDTAQRSFTLVATLWGVLHQGHVEEIAPLAERALQRWPDRSTPGWADAAATLATCRYLRGDPADAIDIAQAALPFADRSPYAPSTLRRVICQARCSLGDVHGAIAAIDTAIVHAEGGVNALAMEMRVTRAWLASNVGDDAEAALATVRAVHAEAEAAGAQLNAVWAHTVEASLLAGHAPDLARRVAPEALAASRASHYPACESVNLHTLAQIAIGAGDLAVAARHLLELFDGLVSRGAGGELRNALRATALLFERAGRPDWAALAASAAAMPIVSLFDLPGYELLPLPPTGAAHPLGRRDAVAAARHGLRALLESPSVVPAPGPAEPQGRFVRVGEMWELEWAGRRVSVRDSKGMADLSRLIDADGRELHCLDLADAKVEEHRTGELIDAAARRDYEERIRDLQGDIDDAEAGHDVGRAERAQLELDALVDHLTAALGVGGKTRQGGGTAERARSAVTHRLRATIRRVGRQHPDLGRHLEVSVRTGTYCSYRPERPTKWVT